MNRLNRLASFVLNGLFAGLLMGCATNGKPVNEPPPLKDSHALPLFRGDGAPSDFDALVSSCARADAVLIGEVHGHPQGLDFAAALWDGVLAHTERAALSMEFFERDLQIALDDYLSGVTDETAFKKATGRATSGYPPGHRRMIEAAKGAGRPVFGANAPRRYVRLARLEGYERLSALSPEQRRLFDVPTDMPSEAYHDRFIKLMSEGASDPSHGAPKAGARPPPDPAEELKTLEGFYRSQVVWDSTMSATIDRAMARGLAPVVHVVGGFHVDEDGGTLQLLRKKRPDAAIITIAVEEVDAAALRAEDRGIADFVVYVGPPPAGDPR